MTRLANVGDVSSTDCRDAKPEHAEQAHEQLIVRAGGAAADNRDSYAAEQGYDSRSAVLHKAVRLLKAVELGDAYEDAWREWESSGEADAWEAVTADGGAR